MEINTTESASKSDYWVATYADGSVQSYKYDEKFIDDLRDLELEELIIPEGVIIIDNHYCPVKKHY